MKQTGFVLVGEIVKPHGIRGELRVRSHAESPELFGLVPAIHLREPGAKPAARVIRSWREHKGFVLLTLDGVTDRDGAEALRGREVLVREADLPDLDEDEHYLYQLMGCRVTLEDGSPVGVLEHFFETAGQDTWVIVNEAGAEILLPAVPEFVLDVDLDAGVIVVAPPEGLLDLYLNPEPPKAKPVRPRRGKGGKQAGTA
ncbi:16S rRNA processing protein RimM [Pseudodesulfovibrio sp. F-1]|uniref:Ribosome maturation factor RimM n=1 Tax=Pseudodesulfovibrio alkaliphilus TaxID=2661613 RepID=A0A7K1KNZ8_9BACT|nr:ribosome maturation factor RimM [Pseudodesulfovibrio alkaliphilus]MUM77730.1 16S rRNA processing protein RimM [Pseudodesulfovibrio alkaliphilus]